MTIVFLFKSGKEVRMKCEDFETSKSNGRVIEWKATGITENKAIDMNMDNIDCIYRVMSDEKEE